MERPFLFITLALLSGIICAYVFGMSLAFWVSLLFVSITIFLISILRKKASLVPIFLIIFFLGGLLFNLRINNSKLKAFTNKNLQILGTVNEIRKENSEEASYILVVEGIKDGSSYIEIKEKTVFKIYGDTRLGLGDQIEFTGKFDLPLTNTNPMLFNYRLNLLADQVYTTIYIKDSNIIRVKENTSIFYQMKRNFSQRVESLFSTYLIKPHSDLISAIILGDYSYIEEDNIAVYRELGLSHILAVSGLHIGIISAFILFVLSNLGIKRLVTSLLTLGTIWFYGFLIGFPPSILRANIMITILMLGFLLRRVNDSLNALFITLFIILIFNPLLIFSLSLHLSFIATFSLIYLTPHIRDKLFFMKDSYSSNLATILAVQLGILPLQAYYFNRIYILALVTNIMLAPILSLALIISVVMVFFSYSINFINTFIGGVLDGLLYINSVFMDLIYKLRFLTIKIHSPTIYEFILYYAFILLLIKVPEMKKLPIYVKKLGLIFLLICLLINSLYINRYDSPLEIHFIDVGQGDAAYIRFKNRNYLIDTGGSKFGTFDISKNITLAYLEKLGVKSLDGLFISHFHEDHAQGLALILDNLRVENVFISYEDKENILYQELLKRRVNPILLRKGQKVKLDNDLDLYALSPLSPDYTSGTNENNMSLVFNLTFKGKNILFTGDVEGEVEAYLSKSPLEEIDLIKIPHHGSGTSSIEEFILKIRPHIGIISVGRNNSYGHPNREVLSRYEGIGTRIYRTDHQGLIKARINEKDIKVESYMYENKERDIALNFLFHILSFIILVIGIKIFNIKKEGYEEIELQGFL